MHFCVLLITNIIDFFILDQYFYCFTKERKSNHSFYYIIILFFGFLLSIINMIGHPLLNLLSSIVLIYCYGTNYKLEMRHYIILPAFYIGLGFVTEPIGVLIIDTIMEIVPRLSEEIVYAIAIIVAEVIRFLIVLIIKMYWKTQLIKLPLKQYFLLCTAPIIGIAICCLLIQTLWLYDTPEEKFLCASIVLMVLFSNISVFAVFKKLNDVFLDIHRNEMLIQEANLKEEYYKQVDNSNRQIRKIRHDLKNRLLGIYSIQDNPQLIRNEIMAILGDLEESKQKIYTVNCILNSVLNAKYAIAYKKNIAVENNILVPKYMNISYGDMGVLFGNLLDNAIEACVNMSEKKRWIEVGAYYSEHVLVIKIRNSKPINSVSKEDHCNHGIGLKSVQQIVEKYHGVMEYQDMGEIFECSAILYGIRDDKDLASV